MTDPIPAPLHDLLDGRLDDDAAAAVRARIASDPDWAEAWQDLQRIQGWVRAHGPAGADRDPPAALRTGILARVATAGAEVADGDAADTPDGPAARSAATPRLLRILTLSYASAALLVVGFTVTYVAFWTGPEAGPPRDEAPVETADGSVPRAFDKRVQETADETADGARAGHLQRAKADPEDEQEGAAPTLGAEARRLAERGEGFHAGPGGGVRPRLRAPSDEPAAPPPPARAEPQDGARPPDGAPPQGKVRAGATVARGNGSREAARLEKKARPDAGEPMSEEDAPTGAGAVDAEEVERLDGGAGVPPAEAPAPAAAPQPKPADTWHGPASRLARLGQRLAAGDVVYVLETDDPAGARARLLALLATPGASPPTSPAVGLGGGAGRPAAPQPTAGRAPDAPGAATAAEDRLYRLAAERVAGLAERLDEAPAADLRVHSEIDRALTPALEAALARELVTQLQGGLRSEGRGADRKGASSAAELETKRRSRAGADDDDRPEAPAEADGAGIAGTAKTADEIDGAGKGAASRRGRLPAAPTAPSKRAEPSAAPSPEPDLPAANPPRRLRILILERR